MISVIIPHLNQPAELARCLRSVDEQTQVCERFEIIVVDNGSTESPANICALFESVRLFHQPVPGPGPARNLGVEMAKGDVLAFIDADCVADRNWLAEIERVLRHAPAAEILGGNVGILCAAPDRPTLLEAYESVFAYRMKEYIRKHGFTGTGNLAVRRRVFADVGPFGGIEIAEDAEWGRRASARGHRIRYVPAMTVFHPARKTFAELAEKWDRHVAHDFVAFRSKRLWWIRWIIRSAAVAASPVFELGRIMMSARLEGLRPRCLAMLGVVRIRLYRARTMLRLAFGTDALAMSAKWNRTGKLRDA